MNGNKSNHSQPEQRRTARMRRLVTAIGMLVIALITGCAKNYTDYGSFVHEPRPLVSTAEYRLSPPDQVTIVSKRVREINGHSEIIRPDGRITLPLLGSVFVAGKTVEQVSAELRGLSTVYYEDADVSVRVVGFNSKKIFVFGEVGSPGAYPYDGANTILETLAVAQPTRLANPDKIHVLRPNNRGQLIKRMTVSLDDMVKLGNTELDALLEEGDIIYVPPNPLASVGLVFQQLLLPIQPAAATMAGPANMSTTFGQAPYGNSTNGGTNAN